MAKIISIINQKGGVGKTTTSVSLSSALSKKGYKVLLVDLLKRLSSAMDTFIFKLLLLLAMTEQVDLPSPG